jgi:hypothetical protein
MRFAGRPLSRCPSSHGEVGSGSGERFRTSSIQPRRVSVAVGTHIGGGFFSGGSDAGVMPPVPRRTRRLSHHLLVLDYYILYISGNLCNSLGRRFTRPQDGQGFTDVKLTLTQVRESRIEAGGLRTWAESCDLLASRRRPMPRPGLEQAASSGVGPLALLVHFQGAAPFPRRVSERSGVPGHWSPMNWRGIAS